MSVRTPGVEATGHAFVTLEFLLRGFGLEDQDCVEGDEHGQEDEEDQGIDEEDEAEGVGGQDL